MSLSILELASGRFQVLATEWAQASLLGSAALMKHLFRARIEVSLYLCLPVVLPKQKGERQSFGAPGLLYTEKWCFYM